MMRLCPKCGDYYADGSLAFCLNDGTPLADLNPHSESWKEGTRVIEEKENALRKQTRKLKWRRFVLTAMTTLIITMVVCVVAINSYIYLKPKPEEVALTKPLIPATAPAEPDVSPTPSTPAQASPTPSPNPAETRKPTPTPTPTPTPVYKISGRVTDGSKALGGVQVTLGGAKTASTTTDAKGNYTFTQLLAGGSYTITPASAKINFTPSRRSITKLAKDESAYFVGTSPECSDAEKSREREVVLNRCRQVWLRSIEGERSKIIAEYFLAGIENINAGLSAKIDYQITFDKTCKAGVVTARYMWQVTAPRIRTVPRPKEKRFTVVKTGEAWRCG